MLPVSSNNLADSSSMRRDTMHAASIPVSRGIEPDGTGKFSNGNSGLRLRRRRFIGYSFARLLYKADH